MLGTAELRSFKPGKDSSFLSARSRRPMMESTPAEKTGEE